MNDKPLEHRFIAYSDDTKGGYNPSYFQVRLYEALAKFRKVPKMRVTIEIENDDGTYDMITASQANDKVTFKEATIYQESSLDLFDKLAKQLTEKIKLDNDHTAPSDGFFTVSSRGDE